MRYSKDIGSYIGGSDVRGNTAITKTDPGTGTTLATIYPADAEVIEQAISAGETAQPGWEALGAHKRADILKRATALIQERTDEIAALVAQETGRSKKQTVGEIEGAGKGGAYLIEHLGDYFAPHPLETSNPKREVTMVRSAVGTGALFTPFNTPFYQVCGKLFPALLAGNAVVIKAHELAPYTPVLATKLFIEAGVPRDIISVLQGGREVGEALVRDSRIRFVSITGSSRAASAIITATAPRLARVSAEAGGKNPFVVMPDADLEKAVTDALAGITIDNGQRCASTSRLILVGDTYEPFLEHVKARLDALTFGTDDADDIGALISEERLSAILTKVTDAGTRGTVTGGERIDRPGYFMRPALIEGLTPDDPIAQEELFGPVAIVFRADDLSHALRIANTSPYRLSSAIHTADEKAAERFRREHGAGVTRVNGPTFGSESHMPFGGEGLSGNGGREPGLTALDFYTSLRQVSIDRTQPSL